MSLGSESASSSDESAGGMYGHCIKSFDDDEVDFEEDKMRDLFAGSAFLKVTFLCGPPFLIFLDSLLFTPEE